MSLTFEAACTAWSHPRCLADNISQILRLRCRIVQRKSSWFHIGCQGRKSRLDMRIERSVTVTASFKNLFWRVQVISPWRRARSPKG